MVVSLVRFRAPLTKACTGGLLVALGAQLSGCADMSDSMTTAFADPAKYELYNCKQLETERKSLATRSAELQGLMAKAQSGAGGPVIAELAYRNDYIAVRGQARNADEAWVRNKCRETTPGATLEGAKAVSAPLAAPAQTDRTPHGPTRSGNAIY